MRRPVKIGYDRGALRNPPSRIGPSRTYAALFLAAVVLRLALLGATLVSEPSIEDFLSRSDAGSFLRVANRIYGGASFAGDAGGYHQRVFLGWPLLFGWSLWLGHPVEGMFALDLIFSGLVPCLFLKLSGDRLPAWALCFLTPAWLVYSTYPMSEAAFLACGLGSLVLLGQGSLGRAGLALGWMGAIRPHALALLVGQAVLLHRRRRGIQLGGWIRYAGALSIAPAITLSLNWSLYGDPFHQLHVYSKPLTELNLSLEQAAPFASGHWGAPFYWLIATPLLSSVPALKWTYVYAHVAALVVLAFWGVRDWRRGESSDVDLCMLIWLVANAGLIVSAGPYWGFHSFDRYFLWAWPAGLWILRGRVRLRSPLITGLSLLSLMTALYILLRKSL